MARIVLCDSQDGVEAVHMVTNLGNGDTVALCAACSLDFMRGMVEAADAAGARDAGEEAQAAQGGRLEGEAAPDPPNPKRRRQGRRAASQALTSEASPFPDASPVE